MGHTRSGAKKRKKDEQQKDDEEPRTQSIALKQTSKITREAFWFLLARAGLPVWRAGIYAIATAILMSDSQVAVLCDNQVVVATFNAGTNFHADAHTDLWA